jgi:hypothetical protein
MGSIGDTKVLSIVGAAPELRTGDDADAIFNALAVTELASVWCALQRLSRRDQTDGVWTAKLYFDHLPHEMPDRALDLALEILRSETDKATIMQLNNKLMQVLIYVHGADVIDRLETEAKNNRGLRWLLGGVLIGLDERFTNRIAAIAEVNAWRADAAAHDTPQQPLDCEALSLPELASAWVEQYSKSDRDKDDNFFTMRDYERDLRDDNPDKAIDLILEILKIEINPVLLSVLAAGPLEDVISIETIDRIEHEAAANKRFRDLLGGVWYYRASDELKARLDALIGDRRC